MHPQAHTFRGNQASWANRLTGQEQDDSKHGDEPPLQLVSLGPACALSFPLALRLETKGKVFVGAPNHLVHPPLMLGQLRASRATVPPMGADSCVVYRTRALIGSHSCRFTAMKIPPSLWSPHVDKTVPCACVPMRGHRSATSTSIVSTANALHNDVLPWHQPIDVQPHC